jgi:hypothetical protein
VQVTTRSGRATQAPVRNVRFEILKIKIIIHQLHACEVTPMKHTHEILMPVRCTPVRFMPVRYTPMRCTPMRCTPVRRMPMRCTPMRRMPMNARL